MTDREFHPMEKCTEEIKTLVPGEFKEAVAAVALVKGYSGTSAYVRSVLYREIYGELHMLRLQQDKKT